MLRSQLPTILVICLSLAGCRPSTPAAVPASGETVDKDHLSSKPSPDKATSAAPLPSQPEPANAVAQSSPSASADLNSSTGGPLRDLAARYVESDGQGGWRTNEKAATELERLGADAGNQLLPLLKDSQVEVRRGAAFYALAVFDSSRTEHVAAFSALLDDTDATMRGLGVSAARQMRREDQVALIPRLIAVLASEREADPENRAAMIRLCAALKADAATAVPALAAVLKHDRDARVRSASVAAISQVATPEVAVTHFANGLSDTDASVRLVAAARLRQLGAAAAPAAKPLANALSDADVRVREAAAETLILIGAPAVEPLAAQLTSRNVEVRKYALACLARIGPAAKLALAAIERCKQDPDENVRKLAEAAVRQVAGR